MTAPLTIARITLRNAAVPDDPIAIDGPVAIVAVLDLTSNPNPIEAQRVLVARALHQLVGEQFPSSTLRFAIHDVATWGATDKARSAACWERLLADCSRLSIEPPDPSMRSSELRAPLEASLEEMIDARSVILDQEQGDTQWFDLNRDLWAQRRQDRAWSLPRTMPRFTSGRVAFRRRDEWAFFAGFAAVELCTIALNDRLPIVLVHGAEHRYDAFTTAAIAEMRGFSQPLACLPVSVGSIGDGGVDAFADGLFREHSPEYVRHWLLCGDPRRKQRPLSSGGYDTDHFRLCRERAMSVQGVGDRARRAIGGESACEAATNELQVELDQLHSEFVHALQTEFNVEGASQVLTRVRKRLDRLVRSGERQGLRETLALMESMASTVGIS